MSCAASNAKWLQNHNAVPDSTDCAFPVSYALTPVVPTAIAGITETTRQCSRHKSNGIGPGRDRSPEERVCSGITASFISELGTMFISMLHCLLELAASDALVRN
jgi:hypothetical protein